VALRVRYDVDRGIKIHSHIFVVLRVTAHQRRTVTIEGIGDKGDGIARIDRGYVLIVPETDVDERVTVEVDQARDNVGFASVIKRHAESG